MNPFRAVIFDMDGVIVDSEPVHERAFVDVLRSLGYGFPEGLRFADYVGRSDHVLWQDFVGRHRPAQSLEELLALKRQRVIQLVRRAAPIFRGLPELLEPLAARWPLAVASGSERAVIDAVLALKDLRRRFRVIVSSGEVVHGKPAPDIFLRAARLLDVPPGDCVVIEDSKPGVAAGLAAGMQVVAITNTHPASELRPAPHIVRTYEELGALLLGTR
ncbi:MAG: HAD family phosphatase [Verrucomicrobia bacterium]|nr:HAD family phosphatase [Verrucomicrobiota bacterium]